MNADPRALAGRLRELVAAHGPLLTKEELAYVEKSYLESPGNDHWDVRQYAGGLGVGAREYRVVRGSGSEDVYRSADPVRAGAVRAALNEIESQVTA